MERLPYIAVLAAYALSTVAHLLPTLAGPLAARARAIAVVGAALHLACLLLAIRLGPWGPGFPEALSATSLGIVVAYAWVARGRRLRSLGMLLVPLALVMLGTSMVVPHRQVAALEHTGFSAWLPVHLGLVFVGIAGFALSGAVGLTYLWARHRLKQKRLAGIGHLPSLEVLDRIQFRAMLFGFVFLTLGIGAGGAWAAVSLQETWTVDPKVWFTLLIWFWYGVALQVRLVGGRRGRWTALFSIVGFAGLVFSLLGVNFLVSGWHGYAG